MSIFSAVAAEGHNKELAVKAKELQEAIDVRNWKGVEAVQKWMEKGPFSE